MPKPNQALLVFYKYPELGKVKTRLAKDLGESITLDVYKMLCSSTFEVCKQFKQFEGNHTTFFFFFTPKERSEASRDMLGSMGMVLPQEGRDLGDRMKNAFQVVFNDGFTQAIIIGTDCPDLSVEHINKGFHLLKNKDVVIGPAEDGGYYLLGMNKPVKPELFNNVEWSTSLVLEQTQSRVQQLNLSFEFLPVLNDIDTLMDYSQWIQSKTFL
jgi:uncharacterized protein